MSIPDGLFSIVYIKNKNQLILLKRFVDTESVIENVIRSA